MRSLSPAHICAHMGGPRFLLHCSTRAELRRLFAPNTHLRYLHNCSNGATNLRLNRQRIVKIAVVDASLGHRRVIIHRCPAAIFHILRAKCRTDIQPPIAIGML